MYFLFPFMLIFSLPNILMALAAVIPAIWLLIKVYRLDKIQKTVGLDLRAFDDAVTFKLLMLMGKQRKDKKTRS